MRQPIVAGQFYSDDFDKLNKSIETSFENGPGASPIDKRDKTVLGMVVPHSKYDYCGKCMAWAYKEIGESEYPDSYIILGGIPFFNRVLQIITLEILGLHIIWRSLIIGSVLYFGPIYAKRYFKYKRRNRLYKQKLEKVAGEEISKAMSNA